MKYLFSDWDRFFFEIKKSPHVFLFLDYDGTLTSIVSTPEKAKLPPRVRQSIKRLQKNPRYTIAIISGRSLKDIKRMVGIRGLIYAGNHGLEIEGVRSRIPRPVSGATSSIIKKIRSALERELRGIRGARVEDKGCTLSVHFRLVNYRQRPLVKKIFRDIVRPDVSSGKIKVSSGKMVLEVRPAVEWGKGNAVLHIIAGKRGAMPVYIGDDLTDQDAFRAIRGRGISIFVGRPERAIRADYFLRGPKDVKDFIARLLDLQ
jgi:trehalose-phosphatase